MTIQYTSPFSISFYRFDNNEHMTIDPLSQTVIDADTGNFLLNFKPSGVTDVNGNRLVEQDGTPPDCVITLISLTGDDDPIEP